MQRRQHVRDLKAEVVLVLDPSPPDAAVQTGVAAGPTGTSGTFRVLCRQAVRSYSCSDAADDGVFEARRLQAIAYRLRGLDGSGVCRDSDADFSFVTAYWSVTDAYESTARRQPLSCLNLGLDHLQHNLTLSLHRAWDTDASSGCLSSLNNLHLNASKGGSSDTDWDTAPHAGAGAGAGAGTGASVVSDSDHFLALPESTLHLEFSDRQSEVGGSVISAARRRLLLCMSVCLSHSLSLSPHFFFSFLCFLSHFYRCLRCALWQCVIGSDAQSDQQDACRVSRQLKPPMRGRLHLVSATARSPSRLRPRPLRPTHPHVYQCLYYYT